MLESVDDFLIFTNYQLIKNFLEILQRNITKIIFIRTHRLFNNVLVKL